MSPETRDQEDKALRFVTFCVRRLKSGQTEDQIANGLGFGSPEVLYQQLERDGSPVCGVYGQLYPDSDHGKVSLRDAYKIRRVFRKLAKRRSIGSLRRLTVFVRHENVVRLLKFLGYRLE